MCFRAFQVEKYRINEHMSNIHTVLLKQFILSVFFDSYSY